jgi:putative glutathione S-transferase
MLDGVWSDGKYSPDNNDAEGQFVRKATTFRDWVRADGSTPFVPESGRYHLYVSYACPWAHRTLIFRKLKGLERHIDVSVVHPLMLDNGWEFSRDGACIPDSVNHKRYLHETYAAARADFTGRVTVPVLWDKQRNTIVNNESSEIIRMFNREFDALDGVTGDDFCPPELLADIDDINAKIYDNVNNGVYACGFAGSQRAYERAFDALFLTLDELDARLGERRYLCGDRITEADWRLFVTLIRFDAVYVCHFKCNQQRIVDYQNLAGYTRELYQWPGVAETVNLEHIKTHYFVSHTSLNPRQTVPKGPRLDFTSPHGRG